MRLEHREGGAPESGSKVSGADCPLVTIDARVTSRVGT
jgi:hypothetical protein